MSKFTLGLATVLTLGLFLFVLAGAPLLKQPLSPDEHIAAHLQALESALTPPEDWERSAVLHEQLERGWESVQRRIQFSVEETDMLAFTDEIVRLKAAIELRERPLAWEALRMLSSVWNRMR